MSYDVEFIAVLQDATTQSIRIPWLVSIGRLISCDGRERIRSTKTGDENPQRLRIDTQHEKEGRGQ